MENATSDVIQPSSRQGEGTIEAKQVLDWQNSIQRCVSMLQQRQNEADAFERLSSCHQQMRDHPSAFTYALKAADRFIDRRDFPKALELIHRALHLEVDPFECHNRITMIQDLFRSKRLDQIPTLIAEIIHQIPAKELLNFWKNLRLISLSAANPYPLSESREEFLFFVTDGAVEIKKAEPDEGLPPLPPLKTGDLWLTPPGEAANYILSAPTSAQILVADRQLVGTVIRSHARLKKQFETALKQQRAIMIAAKSQSLAACSFNDLSTIVSFSHEIVLSKDETVLEPDHVFFSSLMIILAGSLRIGVKTPTVSVIKELKVGDIFYPAFFRSREQIKTNLAIDNDIRALIINRKDFKTAFCASPKLKAALLGTRPPAEPSAQPVSNLNPRPESVSMPTPATPELEKPLIVDPSISTEMAAPGLEPCDTAFDVSEMPTERIRIQDREKQPKAISELSAEAIEAAPEVNPTSKTTLIFPELEQLLPAAEVRELSGNQRVFERNELGVSVYLVLDGEISISTLDRFGRRIELLRVEEGDYFGEDIFFGRSKRKVSASSIDQATLGEIPSPLFQRFLNESLETHEKILTRYNERGQFMNFAASVIARESSIEEKQLFFTLGRTIHRVSDLADSELGIITAGTVTEYDSSNAVNCIYGPCELVGETSFFQSIKPVLPPRRIRESSRLKILALDETQLARIAHRYPAILSEVWLTFLHRNYPEMYRAVSLFENRLF